jgi:hypothetical protein
MCSDALPSTLPAPPPEPSTVNLDTTTMCALVSQVSWSAPEDPAITAWSQRAATWRQCVQEEAKVGGDKGGSKGLLEKCTHAAHRPA